MKKLWVLALVSVLGVAMAAYAAPAPFYLWQSLATGRYMCSANNPGSGWARFSGPYNNAGCRDY
ncbi:hypothetical protein OGV25_18595 [Pseudomonas sp. P1B16]|jgi:hypothetical protein|uniref:Secreted protein n=1 Tax=Pseudomonas capeferrum TaxID=1495066 RepID=A0ABY7R519_9PSED|nr:MULTISPECIES: hypothetical protein [Pseudomonas]MCH7298933.1 hypothetical protein [Pseudomonas capeferrum]MDD2064864.1 hypothetical protein [Pseudomonas sp. 25571]MDD2128489.1 hypothetical protein [Pseudomonas sp. 17391]UVL02575.1 hypothetical protein LOY26_19285 [Pseudomonas sp. B21-047]WCH98852.1 hypothetical protein PMC74_19000 [Pseudomonas capeferrum]